LQESASFLVLSVHRSEQTLNLQTGAPKTIYFSHRL
jgi:hypothetical protein